MKMVWKEDGQMEVLVRVTGGQNILYRQLEGTNQNLTLGLQMG